MSKELTVWWGARVVGSLMLNAHGEMRFVYDAAWLEDGNTPPLSVSLPKRAASFSRRQCQPFFEGLLPEESQREAVAAALGTSKSNEFRLLVALGGEVAGALTLWPKGENPPSFDQAAATSPLETAALVEILAALPHRPLLVGQPGLRLSLAGAQSKLPVVLVEGRIALPAPGQPTSHILKPPIERFAATTENEALAMRLAARMGLPAAPIEVRTVAGKSFLLVERYDRWPGPDGRIHRWHQEDFCQALGISSGRKYAADGGPTFKQCFALVRRACTRPAAAALQLLDAAIIQVILGNADAHGKNYSLLYRSKTVELAPLYDLMTTVLYPDLSPRLAMRIGKAVVLEELRRQDWQVFAADAEMSAPFVLRRARELTTLAKEKAMIVAAELVAPGLNEAALHQQAQLIVQRAERLASQL